jgi:hypothetical protein
MPAPFEIITGVGRLYIAPVGTAFPDLDAAPAAPWRDVGDTQDGVTVTLDETIDDIITDQSHGSVKSSRSEESLVIETKLAHATLENLADVLGTTVTDTPAGVGTIGTRKVGLYRGQVVATHALIFRGNSAYGDWPSQYEVPVGSFQGAVEMADTRDGNRQIAVEFHAKVDPDATSEDEKFGRLIMQDAEAS